MISTVTMGKNQMFKHHRNRTGECARLVGVEGWTPDRKLIKLIADLKNEGRL